MPGAGPLSAHAGRRAGAYLPAARVSELPAAAAVPPRPGPCARYAAAWPCSTANTVAQALFSIAGYAAAALPCSNAGVVAQASPCSITGIVAQAPCSIAGVVAPAPCSIAGVAGKVAQAPP